MVKKSKTLEDFIEEEIETCKAEREKIPPVEHNNHPATTRDYLTARIATLKDVLSWIKK